MMKLKYFLIPLAMLAFTGTTPAGILDKIVPRDYRLEKMMAEPIAMRPMSARSDIEDIEDRLDQLEEAIRSAEIDAMLAAERNSYIEE
jgi:hypothetical protein